jgi:hypothetical protein
VRPAAIRGTVLVSGLVLVAGLLLAPELPVSAITALSVVWYLGLIALTASACVVLSRWVGRVATVVLVALGLALPILLTALPVGPALAVRLPCPRNWGWLPTWLLRSSPMGSLVFEVDSTPVKVCYGRPAARGRRMLGAKPVPYGRLWRTGANEPTTIISPVPLEVAGVAVPAGRTALYTIPGPESWEIILNRSTGQWGIESEYTPVVRAAELGRAIVGAEQSGTHVERLHFDADRRPDGSVDLVLAWETTRVRVPLRRAPR